MSMCTFVGSEIQVLCNFDCKNSCFVCIVLDKALLRKGVRHSWKLGIRLNGQMSSCLRHEGQLGLLRTQIFPCEYCFL